MNTSTLPPVITRGPGGRRIIAAPALVVETEGSGPVTRRTAPIEEEAPMPRVIEPRPCVVCGTEFTPPPAPRLREVCSDECHAERSRRQKMSADERAARAAAFTAERPVAVSVDDLAARVTGMPGFQDETEGIEDQSREEGYAAGRAAALDELVRDLDREIADQRLVVLEAEHRIEVLEVTRTWVAQRRAAPEPVEVLEV